MCVSLCVSECVCVVFGGRLGGLCVLVCQQVCMCGVSANVCLWGRRLCDCGVGWRGLCMCLCVCVQRDMCM